ncbi:SGNH/GDSL hydrolase family protein [Sphingomonas sp. ac-8]|uniref:SGNH/GDSL hydrolase family protein n=1 Tax=Sphingomonas sp. ac-8 TaxID=3242977 RepID=UPI003A80AA0A
MLPVPPAVIVTDAATTGIAGAVRVPATSGSFRRTGPPVVPIAADPALYGASDGAGNTAFGAFVQWEWMSDASQLDLLVLKYNAVFDLFVDGQPVQAGAFATPATGDRRLVKLDWSADADPRRPRHYRLAGTNLLFGGLYLDAAGSAWAPGDRAGAGLLAVLGDSYTQGTGALSAARNWVAAAAAQLQMDGWSDGIGGSGWNSPGSNAPVARIGRGIAVLTRAPDIVVTALGYNDAAVDAAGVQRLRASYDATIAAIRAAWPGARLVSLGPWTPLGPTGGLGTVRAAIAERAAAAGVRFVDLEGMIGAGNRALYTGTDSVHPTPQGHVYLGRRIGQAIAAAMA